MFCPVEYSHSLSTIAHTLVDIILSKEIYYPHGPHMNTTALATLNTFNMHRITIS